MCKGFVDGWAAEYCSIYPRGLLFVTGCVSSAELDDLEQVASPEGSIILWHSLGEQQATALDNVINRFQSVNQGTRVFVKAYPSAGALVRDYKTAVNSGLGADIILTNSTRIPELADLGYIQPIDDKVHASRIGSISRHRHRHFALR